MKLHFLLLVALTLPACRSEAKPGTKEGTGEGAAEAELAVFDLTPCAEGTMTVEEFIRRCQRASGVEFTCEQATRMTMQTEVARFDGPARVSEEDFESFVAAQLARCGLTCRAIGPPRSRVLVVERGRQ